MSTQGWTSAHATPVTITRQSWHATTVQRKYVLLQAYFLVYRLFHVRDYWNITTNKMHRWYLITISLTQHNDPITVITLGDGHQTCSKSFVDIYKCFSIFPLNVLLSHYPYDIPHPMHITPPELWNHGWWIFISLHAFKFSWMSHGLLGEGKEKYSSSTVPKFRIIWHVASLSDMYMNIRST